MSVGDLLLPALACRWGGAREGLSGRPLDSRIFMKSTVFKLESRLVFLLLIFMGIPGAGPVGLGTRGQDDISGLTGIPEMEEFGGEVLGRRLFTSCTPTNPT